MTKEFSHVELKITIPKLQALQTNELIDYIKTALRHGELPLGHQNNASEDRWSKVEKLLFTKLKKTQIKSLPEEFQLILGFRNGERNTEGLSSAELDFLREEIKLIEWSGPMSDHKLTLIVDKILSPFSLLGIFLILIFIFVIQLITVPKSNINCADPIGDYQKDVCERAYERTFEEKWGRKPGKLPIP